MDPDADREEVVISVPESLQVTSDFERKVDLDVSTPAQPGRRGTQVDLNLELQRLDACMKAARAQR